MGFFDLFKKGVSGYNDAYDYRTDAVLQCVDKLLDGEIGDLRKIKNGNDWMFAGGTIRGLMGTQVLNEYYYSEIEGYYHRSTSLDVCVKEMCNKINKTDFIRQCDQYANRPIGGM